MKTFCNISEETYTQASVSCYTKRSADIKCRFERSVHHHCFPRQSCPPLHCKWMWTAMVTRPCCVTIAYSGHTGEVSIFSLVNNATLENEAFGSCRVERQNCKCCLRRTQCFRWRNELNAIWDSEMLLKMIEQCEFSKFNKQFPNHS